jgi:hypothetical protein
MTAKSCICWNLPIATAFLIVNPDNPRDRSSIATCGSPEGAVFRVVLGKRHILDHPTPQRLARAIGLDLDVREDKVCDLIVVGTSPLASVIPNRTPEGAFCNDCRSIRADRWSKRRAAEKAGGRQGLVSIFLFIVSLFGAAGGASTG